jgi:hypothetical protein
MYTVRALLHCSSHGCVDEFRVVLSKRAPMILPSSAQGSSSAQHDPAPRQGCAGASLTQGGPTQQLSEHRGADGAAPNARGLHGGADEQVQRPDGEAKLGCYAI